MRDHVGAEEPKVSVRPRCGAFFRGACSVSQWRAGTGIDVAEGVEATLRQHGLREEDLLCRGELIRAKECEVKVKACEEQCLIPSLRM